MASVLHYFGEMLPYQLVCLPVYLCVRFFVLRRARGKGVRTNLLREGLLLLFTLFAVGLASQTILPELELNEHGKLAINGLFSHRVVEWNGERVLLGVNLVPFKSIRAFYHYGTPSMILINLAGNVLMFAPIGFCLPLLWRRWRRWYKTVPFGMLCSVAIECIQIVTGRSVDVDDVILNTIGVLLGYLTFALVRLCLPRLVEKTTG